MSHLTSFIHMFQGAPQPETRGPFCASTCGLVRRVRSRRLVYAPLRHKSLLLRHHSVINLQSLIPATMECAVNTVTGTTTWTRLVTLLSLEAITGKGKPQHLIGQCSMPRLWIQREFTRSLLYFSFPHGILDIVLHTWEKITFRSYSTLFPMVSYLLREREERASELEST